MLDLTFAKRAALEPRFHLQDVAKLGGPRPSPQALSDHARTQLGNIVDNLAGQNRCRTHLEELAPLVTCRVQGGGGDQSPLGDGNGAQLAETVWLSQKATVSRELAASRFLTLILADPGRAY